RSATGRASRRKSSAGLCFTFSIQSSLTVSLPRLGRGARTGWRRRLAGRETGEFVMAAQSQAELVKTLVDAGVHFGHRVSRWNPKMEPYIHGKRNMIHVIDVRETIKGLLRAKRL